MHFVQKGDTLWEIARAYSIDLSELRAWNNLADSDSLIRPGEILILTPASMQL